MTTNPLHDRLRLAEKITPDAIESIKADLGIDLGVIRVAYIEIKGASAADSFYFSCLSPSRHDWSDAGFAKFAASWRAEAHELIEEGSIGEAIATSLLDDGMDEMALIEAILGAARVALTPMFADEKIRNFIAVCTAAKDACNELDSTTRDILRDVPGAKERLEQQFAAIRRHDNDPQMVAMSGGRFMPA